MSAYTEHSGWFVPVTRLSFRTTEPVVWEVGAKGSGLVITVPAGYVFDLSVPRLMRWLFDPRERRYLKAAALHDWLFDQSWTLVAAGAVFHDALAADGVSAWRRIAMWLAVSLFGQRRR